MDVNTMATRQQMRSYVCGQCHVTYDFQSPHKRLTFPWAKGIRVEDIIALENEQKINEWTHPDTGTQLIKAHHPEFKMWNQAPPLTLSSWIRPLESDTFPRAPSDLRT
jgi:nitrite reductase (cytochrome c-552)